MALRLMGVEARLGDGRGFPRRHELKGGSAGERAGLRNADAAERDRLPARVRENMSIGASVQGAVFGVWNERGKGPSYSSYL